MEVDEMRQKRRASSRPEAGAGTGVTKGAGRLDKKPRLSEDEGEDEELDETGEALMQLSLGSAVRCRELEGSVLTTVLMPRPHQICIGVEKAGMAYAA